MKRPDYLIRNYRSDDFDKIAARYIERSRESGRSITAGAIAAYLKRPGFTAEKDIILALNGDTVIGYAHLTREIAVGRILLGGWVEPSWRRKGIATELLRHINARAAECGITTISSDIPQENRITRAVLPKLGFTFVRRYLDIEIGRTAVLDISDSPCTECRRLRSGEEATVMELQNRAFRDHWRYNPYDIDTFLFDIDWNSRSPEDIIVYEENGTITAFCWTELHTILNISGTEKQGGINLIGVDPEHRNRGIGRKILTSGLRHLVEKGVASVTLQVDSENKPARELYHAAGFREYASTLWYEKSL